ncbi:MAG: porin [Rhodospirillaceae bacterium]|nr:porin [Rhodospirillales bacterium]
MKKVLIASTALVAATLVSAGAASASEKIKLNLGGYSKWWVVAAQQDSSFQSNHNTANIQGDYNNVDIKGDNEVYFGGSTTLDNGLKVGVDIQLEAGGHTDQSSDTIDESYVFIQGGFGKFIVGAKNNGTYLIHNTAPDAAGNWNEGGILTGGFSVAKPTNVQTITPLATGGNTTAIVTDGDAEGITYVSPTFYGFTAGASYKPNVKEDDRGTTNLSTATAVASDVYGAGVLYANTFGGVGVKVDAGFATYAVEGTGTGGIVVGGGLGSSDVDEYSTGAQLSYAGFTLGGSYRKVNADATLSELSGDAFDVGLQYASGPYAVSIAYFQSKVDGSKVIAGDDEIEFYQASGKYNLGAGVDALASVGYASFEDESGLVQTKNEGWVVMTGLSLAF